MTAVLNTPAALDLGIPWGNSFAQLGPSFYTELPPSPLPDPHLVALNAALARELGLDIGVLESDLGIAAFTGNAQVAQARPLASVYSGHQFGVWAGQLGDGRAILLGEGDTPLGAQEFQLKGSGRTPYSRMGDGRAVLRSYKEYPGSPLVRPGAPAACRISSSVGPNRAIVRRSAGLRSRTRS